MLQKAIIYTNKESELFLAWFQHLSTGTNSQAPFKIYHVPDNVHNVQHSYDNYGLEIKTGV